MMRTAVVQTAPMLTDEEEFRQGWTEQEMSGNFLPSGKNFTPNNGYGAQGDVRFLIALLGMLNYDQVIHLTPEAAQDIAHALAVSSLRTSTRS